MMKYKRIFIIVMDSLGMGEMPDSFKYGDKRVNTFRHIYDKCGHLDIPNLEHLGLKDILDINDLTKVKHTNSVLTLLNESSIGKDTLTGHWEMMGLYIDKPLITFTDTGFPKALIDEIEKQTGHKCIGNYAASGTEIIKELGEQHIKEKSLIIYTSADSVLQLAAHEKYFGLDELYRCCQIVRNICYKDEWKVGRVIARPFIGENKDEFVRTSNRHDYSIEPPQCTVLELLHNIGVNVVSIGKIKDIFSNRGINSAITSISNEDGMNKLIDTVKTMGEGLCYVNLVDFDSKFGHRRDVKGYARAIEAFDKKLKDVLDDLKEDDLLIITADHGNDPTHIGSDHTREKVPFIAYSKSLSGGKKIKERDSFADIGITVLYNFGIKKNDYMIGQVIKELF